MAKFEQNERPIGVETPLGPNELVLRSFSGEEHMSGLFSFDLELLADADNAIVDPNKIVGKPVDFYVRHPGGEQRYFNGMVSNFGFGGTGSRGHIYRATVVPWLWFLTRSSECRVYETAETKSAKDVIEDVFKNFGFTDFEWKAKRTLAKREFCVQYEETHFDFVSRLLQHEGIYYYFKHEKGKNTLVLADDITGVEDCSTDGDVSLASNLSQPEITDKITSWHHEYSFTTGKHTHTDYDFKKPSTDLSTTAKSIVKTPSIDKYEHYSDAAGYYQNGDGKDLIATRIEQDECGYNVVSGGSVCRDFSPGYRFKLGKHHEQSEAGKKWVLTSVRHDANLGGSYVTSGSHSDEIYSNGFTCIPSDVPYRPARVTPLPRIKGIQTALVVGPAGKEIYTDEFGRVKVQFHWDREGKKDDKSSFWVRTAHPWTGKQWGIVHIPRIGQEVVIDFINGDPDRPLLVSMLYNQEKMPPYELEANMTQSGIKTRSTPGGGVDNFNELRFEDKKGEEQVYLHAEKNLDTVVENNETRKVGHEKKDKGDQEIDIYNEQKLIVGVESGSGSQTVEIQKDQTTTLNQGNQATTVKLGDLTTKVSAGLAKHEAMKSIELKVGASSIKLEPAKITIKAPEIAIAGDMKVDVKGLMTSVQGSAMLDLKGGIVKVN
ncbi:MAG: type VI secretion system Vgr family protein [Planctomycetaceae bacterium]